MFSPKSTTVLTAFLLQQDGNPQKKVSQRNVGWDFGGVVWCFCVLGDGNVEEFLRMEFEIHVDVFGEVLIGCLLILSRWINAK